ncbi:MAG TPA: acyl-ACP thioesterase domain-containing protein [Ktedonobacteraceae bacterium]|nr:acyl-ACP thioesterase domain-containing protein [Ktedonobacteraceae bacterium]
MNRQFCLTHTVRYDECNCDGFLTPAAFLRYMQEIAARDAQDARLDGNGYWVIKRTVISFASPIPIHTRLELKTYGIGFSRITAQRGYEAHLASAPQEEPLASAHTLWVYVDPHGRPTRLPERTAQIWLPDGVTAPKPEPPFPAFPDYSPVTTSAMVHFSEIDLMQHLNNASAVEMLDNAGWQALGTTEITPAMASFKIRHYDIEYSDSPRFGEHLEVQTWFEPYPETGQEFSRFQRITREGKTMVRAYSRWFFEKPLTGP